jgi:hypothetical protein
MGITIEDRHVRRRLAILRHAEEATGNVAMTCRYYGRDDGHHGGGTDRGSPGMALVPFVDRDGTRYVTDREPSRSKTLLRGGVGQRRARRRRPRRCPPQPPPGWSA